MDVQVKEGYYVTKKYASLERFITYFYQIDGIRRTGAKNVLFVGVGDGVVPYFLRAAGLKVVTLDFDPLLKPDVVGDIRALPFGNQSFDLTCAYEVLEHLPLEESRKALQELARVSRGDVLVSVPHRRTGLEVVIKFPYIRSLFKRGFLRLAILVPVRFPGFAVSKQHYWEIDGRTTTLKEFRTILGNFYTVRREITPVLDPYRRFFELKKLTD